MKMHTVGLQNQQKQPIAFGRTKATAKAIRTGSKEVFEFLSEDHSNNFTQAYKTKFLKKYKFNIQEQADNNDMLGILVSGFKKKVLNGLSYTYRKLPDSKLASRVIKAKDEYATELYNQSQNGIIEIKTLRDLRHNFPV